ncbi:glycogen/starch/alpha-glucan phosphorylase [Magnetococcus sp. PR-3]|uniref:glycogen/starch/alpha-glucan phosphorylase n=1 Tax=Magnetococcus sp. PR-3 TaxID=3120355 RepID=UPI002FCE22F9
MTLDEQLSESSVHEHDRSDWNATFIKEKLVNYMVHDVGKDPEIASDRDWYYAVVYFVRGVLSERGIRQNRHLRDEKGRRVYYLSMEYLIGRNLMRTILDLDLHTLLGEALAEFDQNMDEILGCEVDAALGNGGLGRLAACILDSIANQSYPGMGYGIRYEFGMFSQSIEEGMQVEHPEHWLRYGNPWEFEQPNVKYRVRFNGKILCFKDAEGNDTCQWVDTEDVVALAFDVPLSGHKTPSTTNLRLWSARATRDFDLSYFNEGNYVEAVKDKAVSENLSKVLYPNDSTLRGQELRLKQEYFFVSASLQDILERFTLENGDIQQFPEKVVIHLNDTHPSLAVPELLRIFCDDYHMSFDEAWELCRRTFTYTNHTLLPEALETWPIAIMEHVLPRHLQLLYQINHQHLKEVKHRYPGDSDILSRMSLIDDVNKRVRMAHVCIVGSYSVNGVAELHSRLMQAGMFKDFKEMRQDVFTNVTNGIDQHRWLNMSNPGLSALIKESIGEKWISDLPALTELAPLADDAAFRRKFHEIKRDNKIRLTQLIADKTGVDLNPDSMFDVQVKRIHEYKRQLLNVMHVITRYMRIRDGIETDLVPRSVIIGGKAAPGYHIAKQIIRLINDVGNTINNDPAVKGMLKMVFLPNYNVSKAEIIMPGSELSEQISTPGMEASGTGNMKFALNGALTIGTLDGANIEIKEEVGDDNIFIFGMTADEANDLRAGGYDPNTFYEKSAELRRVMEMIRDGFFCPDDPGRYSDLYNNLLFGGDHFLLMADYEAYIACQEQVETAYKDQDKWNRMAILNTANMGKFSIDRTVRTYAENVWKVKPMQLQR